MEHPPCAATQRNDKLLLSLFRAIAPGDRRAIRQLLAKSPGAASLSLQTGATRASAASYFLKSIGHHVYQGDTALHVAAAAYDRAIAEELVTLGADVRAANRRGAEPLHYAADGNPAASREKQIAQSAIIEFLIRAGADPDATNKDGVAPLHRAVRTRCTAAVRTLLTCGADPLLRNGSGSTPLHLAVQTTGRGGSGSAAARAQQKEIIGLLLDRGAKPSDEDSAGRPVKDCVKSDWIRALFSPLL